MSSVEPVDTADTLMPVSALGRWAEDASAAYRVAQSLAPTEFVPEAMRHRPELVTATILAGHEIGLQPMASLRSFDIVKGTPTMRANALRGLVQAAGHEVWIDQDSNSQQAIAYGRRRGSGIVQRSHWTMDRARELGLAGRDNWKRQPGAMLIARATAEVCRLTASDVTLGIYAAEEIDEDASSETTASSGTVKPKSRKRTAQRKSAPEPEPPLPEPPAPEPAEPAEPDAEPAEPATPDPPLPEAGGSDG